MTYSRTIPVLRCKPLNEMKRKTKNVVIRIITVKGGRDKTASVSDKTLNHDEVFSL